MLGRLAVSAALIALAACASAERVAPAAPAPPPPVEASASPSPATTAPAPSVAAPDVRLDTPAPQPSRAARDDTVPVPGQVERQAPPPAGDPRSTAERMQDMNSWDRCVTSVQAAFERDPMRPQLSSPEDYCSQSLGMASRTAVPESRRQR